jgi:hypothetical protein
VSLRVDLAAPSIPEAPILISGQRRGAVLVDHRHLHRGDGRDAGRLPPQALDLD